ncbi:MAG: glycosyltransferase family 2 protein [Candidatus Bathyarchaeia archaeon]
MPSLSIYGTVFNNGYVIEESVRSLVNALQNFNKEYEIVVVDNYSTDGTWETLLKLKQEYGNLKLFRSKCSRGKGRDLALRQTSGDYVMYVDFDCIFEPEFGKIVDKLCSICKAGELWNFGFSTRRTMLETIGGWRDLNFGEDWEVASRAMYKGVELKIVLTYPFMANFRVSDKGYSERRYVQGILQYYIRRIRNICDMIRGVNATPAYIIRDERRLRPSVILALFISSAYTISKFLSGKPLMTSDEVSQKMTTYLLPEDVGLPREYLFAYWGKIDAQWLSIRNKVKDVVRKARDAEIAAFPRERAIVIFRSDELFTRWLNSMKNLSKLISGNYKRLRKNDLENKPEF